MNKGSREAVKITNTKSQTTTIFDAISSFDNNNVNSTKIGSLAAVRKIASIELAKSQQQQQHEKNVKKNISSSSNNVKNKNIKQNNNSSSLIVSHDAATLNNSNISNNSNYINNIQSSLRNSLKKSSNSTSQHNINQHGNNANTSTTTAANSSSYNNNSNNNGVKRSSTTVLQRVSSKEKSLSSLRGSEKARTIISISPLVDYQRDVSMNSSIENNFQLKSKKKEEQQKQIELNSSLHNSNNLSTTNNSFRTSRSAGLQNNIINLHSINEQKVTISATQYHLSTIAAASTNAKNSKLNKVKLPPMTINNFIEGSEDGNNNSNGTIDAADLKNLHGNEVKYSKFHNINNNINRNSMNNATSIKSNQSSTKNKGSSNSNSASRYIQSAPTVSRSINLPPIEMNRAVTSIKKS
jgi:hypothetical protein